MVWKWASEQIECIGGLLWRGVACGHFIYSFSKQVSPHCMPDTALGIRDEAIIERDKVPALIEHTFWCWGGRAGSKEKTRCLIIKHAKCCWGSSWEKIPRPFEFICGQGSSLSEEKLKESTRAGGTAKVKAWRPACWRSQVRPGGRWVDDQGVGRGRLEAFFFFLQYYGEPWKGFEHGCCFIQILH